MIMEDSINDEHYSLLTLRFHPDADDFRLRGGPALPP
jgi:hypothetical protein